LVAGSARSKDILQPKQVKTEAEVNPLIASPEMCLNPNDMSSAPNQRASLDAAIAFRLLSGASWRRAREPECWLPPRRELHGLELEIQ
jgi:hypothetical protein